MSRGREIFKMLVSGYRVQLEEKGLLKRRIPYPKPPPPMAKAFKKPLEATGKLEKSLELKGKFEPTESKEITEGIEIPIFKPKKISRVGLRGEEETKDFKTAYPLIPLNPTKNQPILAYTQIGWDDKNGCYKYELIEPELSPRLKNIFIKVNNLLEEKLDVDLSKLKTGGAREYLHKQVLQILDFFEIKLSDMEKKLIDYYIDRDLLGLGNIEALMRDPEIEDISCDGTNIPIYVFHRNPILGSIPTNLVFKNEEELDSYLIRLAQLCGQAISVIDPLLGGTLPDGSRIQGTLSTDIARRGSNFTIRKFTKIPFTPTHLLRFGTIDVTTLAFLWYLVDSGGSVLVSGGTATGKTVLLNILSLFIRPEKKIVSIEDTAELKLPHPHWIPHVARVPMATEAGRLRGEVDLFDLLKESMRQRPDYIIVGEVRGKEAYVLFQQMATGHPSLATIHAETMEKLESRLTTPPISLPASLLESLDLVIFLITMRYRGKFVRKVQSVYEVTGFDLKTKQLKFNKVFEWNPATDKIELKNKSHALWKIMKKSGLKKKNVIEELKRRMGILNWMNEQNLLDYQDVSHVINLYYDFPDHVVDIISGEV